MNPRFAESVNNLFSETAALTGKRNGPGLLDGGPMKTMRKRVVDAVSAAYLLAKLTSIYRTWIWLRDHFDD
jgi:hypothetical protein